MITSADGRCRILGICFIFFLLGGCSFPLVTLPEDYTFSSTDSIGIYYQPCGDMTIDQVYPSVLYLDFLAKGYNVINMNSVKELKNDTILWSNHKTVFNSFLEKKSFSKLRTIFIVHTTIDSARVITHLKEYPIPGGSYFFYRYQTMAVVNSEYVGFDVATKKIVLSRASSDTCYLYSFEEGDVFHEYPWMVAARQVSKTMKDISVCAVESSIFANHKYPVEIYVDKSYRQQFPQWMKRLQLRMLYVNDIFKK